MLQTDYLIIGSGIAGLSAALNLSQNSPECNITIVTKSKLSDSATALAQGGLAGVMGQSDSFEKHINDTLKAGDGLCKRDVVESIICEAPQRINDLATLGASFDLDRNGNYDLALEGGHTRRRIVHKGDHTGREISEVLIRNVQSRSNIRVLEGHFTIDLIVSQGPNRGRVCSGAIVFDQAKKITFPIYSTATILATGGAGQIFKVTTNPTVSTGDGISMAGRAGAVLENMEFFQFHPSALYEENEDTSFLISEAVRGAGAKLRNSSGEQFMFKYDSRGELASRDIVSRAIRSEMETTASECVWLDCRLIPEDEFKTHFPTIYSRCISSDIDPSESMIPVRPSAHYCCGGIKTDLNGATTLKNLYALGECASTGLHGANRLASNSLIEALVIAERCATFLPLHKLSVAQVLPQIAVPVFGNPPAGLVKTLKHSLKDAMWDIAIICMDQQVKETMKVLDIVDKELQLLKECGNNSETMELDNMVYVCRLVLEGSLARKENRGTFFKVSTADTREIERITDFNRVKV